MFVEKVYCDRDLVELLCYVGGPVFLYNFVSMTYDDELGYVDTDDEVRLTSREILRLRECN